MLADVSTENFFLKEIQCLRGVVESSCFNGLWLKDKWGKLRSGGDRKSKIMIDHMGCAFKDRIV